MSHYCIVISEIRRKEVFLDAESEEAALKSVKEDYQAGRIILEKADELKPVFNPKY